MSPYFPPKSHQAHPIPPQHNNPASLTLAVTGDSMSPSRNLPLCLRCRSAIAGFLWRTASHLLKRRLRLAYRPETCDSGFTAARRHRVSLATCSSIDSSFALLTLIGATSFAGDSMSPSRNLPLCLHCRSAIAGFLWRTASHLLKRRLRLAFAGDSMSRQMPRIHQIA